MHSFAAERARRLMNEYGSNGQAFVFVVDFDLEWPVVFPLEQAREQGVLFSLGAYTNHDHAVFQTPLPEHVQWEPQPVAFERYQEAFQIVLNELYAGNSYLVNLTFPTPVQSNLTLADMYAAGRAPYKLLFKDDFVVLSPESFVQIRNGVISSYPMKGTIDASVPDAEQVLLADPKELAEHYTIVDLIRNDIGMVASNVQVRRFRYIDTIHTNRATLLQVSSEITGVLADDYASHIGDVLFQLLPAGSISGAPKKRTVEIIHKAEPYRREYYTGVFGYFDGTTLDSGVMIRFVENRGGQLVFKSGGGITASSSAESEYREMLQKIYVPIVGKPSH